MGVLGPMLNSFWWPGAHFGSFGSICYSFGGRFGVDFGTIFVSKGFVCLFSLRFEARLGGSGQDKLFQLYILLLCAVCLLHQ